MAPVTVDASAIVGGGSGNTGWNARSTFLMEDVGDSFTNTDGITNTQIGDNASREIPAQSFSATGSYSLASVLLPLSRQGSPTDNVYLEIYSDNSDAPSSTVLATSGNVSASTGVINSSGEASYVKFDFASPPSLSNGTRYWIAARRSGSIDASNYIIWHISGATAYANGRVLQWNGTTWTDPGAAYDCAFVCLKTAKSVYQVTQDAELHVWKSSDNGANWAEADAGNGPAVNSSTKPFSCDATWEARGKEPPDDVRCQGIYAGYFSNTNTARVRRFDLITQTWDTTDLGGADYSTDVDFNRNIRIAASKLECDLYYTSLADDADLEYVRFDGAMGAQVQTLAVNSTEASCYSDVMFPNVESTVTSAFDAMFWYDAANDDFAVRTLAGGTLGTETDLDSSAADVETEHASAVYDVYDDSGTKKVIGVYIDSDGHLQERVCSIGVTSASITLGTQHEIVAVTSYAGFSLATCKYGSDLFAFGCTGSAIDAYMDVGAAGTWSAVTNWMTGLTNAVVSTPVPITGVGILVSYVDNGDTKVNLYAVDVSVSGTLATGTGAALAGSLFNDKTGTLATGTGAANAGTIIAPRTIDGTLATGTGVANVGTIKNTVTGSLATGAGAAFEGSRKSAVAGALATGTGAALSGSLKNTLGGSLATGSGAALAGNLNIVVTGITATADLAALDGTVNVGYTVQGSLAIGTGQANAGTVSITGEEDLLQEDRFRFFQIRPLPTGT